MGIVSHILKNGVEKMNTKGDYPIGAADDKTAPYNEPIDVEHKRFISVTISYYDTVSLPEDASDLDINRSFSDKITEGHFPKKFDVDDIVILNE